MSTTLATEATDPRPQTPSPRPEPRGPRPGLAYPLAIFVSAFLLFQVQPLISKFILPWFGGGPAVWTTCMLFFQVLLFAGYAYAHWMTERLSGTGQAVLHVVLISAAVLCLPITPDASWKPVGEVQPIVHIVALLGASVGLPFFILSSTGPLLQRWFSVTRPGASPYRLYALSNLGSLLALVSYPFLFEPAFSVGRQTVIWSCGFGLFALLCAGCAVSMARRGDVAGRAASAVLPGIHDNPPRLRTRLIWFALAMTASVMLLATTNQVCLDVAAVPFLWILPLTLYLLSFILCFDSDRWYSRNLFSFALFVSMIAVCVTMFKGAGVPIVAQITVYFTGLFFCAMVCHGELVRLKPHPRHLTSFYLVVAAGGAAGGIFVGLIAPNVFPAYLELHVGVAGSFVLTGLVWFSNRKVRSLIARYPRTAQAAAIIAAMGLMAALGGHATSSLHNVVAMSRSFYGVLRVEERSTHRPEKHRFQLMNGRIMHGKQFVSDAKRLVPTTYYGYDSGVGCALADRRLDAPQRVGIVGLGVGTLAAYAQPGDSYRFYEINPEVVRLAKTHFTYLSACAGEVEIVLGDARLSLERDPAQNFDVLVLDAFSGDAIPTHLLTAEAFALYVRHLKPDGMLAVHISNLHFELQPVAAAAAEAFGMATVTVSAESDDELGLYANQWCLCSRDEGRLWSDAIYDNVLEPGDERILWTDDRSNLFEILR